MCLGRNTAPALGLMVVLLLAAVSVSPGQNADQDAKAHVEAKKTVKDAVGAFNRTIQVARCSACKGSGEVTCYPPVTTGFSVSTGQGRKERCSACAGTGTSVQCSPNKKGASDLARRYGIAKVFECPNHPVLGATGEYPVEVALSAQYSLERYLDLLDLVKEHIELVEKDKQLRSAVERARTHGRILFEREQSLFEAIAYQVAKSSKDVKGAGVCLAGVVEQVVTLN